MKYLALISLIFVLAACQSKETKIEDRKLGFIDAELNSNETNFTTKAKLNENKPEQGVNFERSFENAPPMIPHTTAGFFPIKKENNICLSCHMPDKIKESGAKEISKTHFQSWRPHLDEKDGKYSNPEESGVYIKELGDLNKSYFNCSQCHVPQTNVRVNIENLFTPEFRKTFGIKESDLKNRVKEGVSN